MPALIRTWIVCVGVVCTSAALAAPAGDARAKYRLATQLDNRGDAEQALVAIEQGLAIAPSDLPLLGLKGTILLKLHDYPKALAAYRAYLEAGAIGANRRQAEKIVKNLRAVESTFADITVANGAATIYLDSRTQGVFCAAAPSCHEPILPGQYRVIAEQSGFERWTGRLSVQADQTATLAITLIEKPSQLTVRVAPRGARVTVDGAVYDKPGKLAAGSHQVVASLAGYMTARQEVAAHEGKPVALEVALVPLVPVQLEPASATLLLDDKPAAVEGGAIAVPPGSHAIIARAPGFGETRIEIPAVRAAGYKLEVALVPLVAIQLEPAGATLVVDDQPARVEHGAIAVPPGAHAVVARAPGFRELRIEIPATRTADYKLVVALAQLVAAQLAPPTTTLTLDGEPVAVEAGAIAIPPGRHAVVARAPGFRELRVEIPAVRPADYRLVARLAPVRVAATARAEGGLTAQRKIALVMGAAGLGIAGLGALGDRQDRPPGDDGPAPVYGIAAGALLTAAVLWLTGAPQKPAAVTVTPRVGTVAGLDLSVRF